MGIIGALSRWRHQRRLRSQARREIDRLFAGPPSLLTQARLSRHHRHRIHLLECDARDEGEIERLLLGIIRHPRSHPLAPRGDEVLELIEYFPREGRLKNIGGANLTRCKKSVDFLGRFHVERIASPPGETHDDDEDQR